MTDDPNGRRDPLPERQSVAGGFSSGFDLTSSIVAGLLIGLGLDWWLGTRPLFIIVFIVAGVATGFYKLWVQSAVLEEQAMERRRGV